MAEVTLAILLFIAVLGITTLICGVWVFYKVMRLLGNLVGFVVNRMVDVLSLLGTVAVRRRQPTRPRVVTVDGVYTLSPVSSAGRDVNRPRKAHAVIPRAPEPLVDDMVRCSLAGCLAPNPRQARYCRRCGQRLAQRNAVRQRPLAVRSE